MIESYQKDLLKNISSWLEILEEISKNSTDTSSLPKLEVSLRSGKLFAGSVIGLKKSADENLLMLLEQADTHTKGRIHLIQCEDIVALSFVDPDTYLSIFSNEKSTVSELELKRKTKSIEDQIAQTIGKCISIALQLDTISESDRYYVFQMVGSLPVIFESLFKDEIGKASVNENIESIEIQVSNTAKATLKDKCLMLHLSKTPDKRHPVEKARLLHAIEKAL